MPTKNKDEYITMRIGETLKGKIQDLVDVGEYDDISKFVREAIIEKLNPTRKVGLSSEELRKAIRQAIKEDPSILADQLKDIGLQFVLKK